MGKVFGATSSPGEVEEAGVPVLLVSEDFWVSRVRRYQHGREKKRGANQTLGKIMNAQVRETDITKLLY